MGKKDIIRQAPRGNSRFAGTGQVSDGHGCLSAPVWGEDAAHDPERIAAASLWIGRAGTCKSLPVVDFYFSVSSMHQA